MTNRGMAINLYQIVKMFGGRDGVCDIKEMLSESFEKDKQTREYRNMTFAEYVNEKRNFLASILGYSQYV